MGRIRSVHPGQWDDEDFVSLSFPARLLAIAIRNECDDNGIFEWKPVVIKMRLFPADNVDVAGLLAELVEYKLVKEFSHGGRKYGAVRNFRRFQRPKKPNSLYPMPDEFRTYVALDADGSELDADEDADSSEQNVVKTGKVRKSSRRGRREEGEKEEGGKNQSSHLPEKPASEPALTASTDEEGSEAEDLDPIANLSPADAAMVAIWRATGATEDQIAGWLVSTRGPNRSRIAEWLKTIPATELPGIVTAILDRAEDSEGTLRDGDGRPIREIWAYLGKAIPAEWAKRQAEDRREAASHGDWTPPKVPWEQRADGLRKGFPWQPTWGRPERAPDFVQQAYRDGQAAQHRSAAQ